MFNLVPFRKNNNERGLLRNSFFDDFFGDDFFSPVVFNNNNFKVDLKEDDASYTLEADLPGVKKEDIALDYDNNYLTICAKRNESVENTNNNYVRKEKYYGEFRRSFYVDNVDETNVSASFTDGVLSISLPKKEKGMQKKTIEIQ